MAQVVLAAPWRGCWTGEEESGCRERREEVPREVSQGVVRQTRHGEWRRGPAHRVGETGEQSPQASGRESLRHHRGPDGPWCCSRGRGPREGPWGKETSRLSGKPQCPALRRGAPRRTPTSGLCHSRSSLLPQLFRTRGSTPSCVCSPGWEVSPFHFGGAEEPCIFLLKLSQPAPRPLECLTWLRSPTAWSLAGSCGKHPTTGRSSHAPASETSGEPAAWPQISGSGHWP